MQQKGLDQKIADIYEDVLRKEKVSIHLDGLEELIDKREEELEHLEAVVATQLYQLEKSDTTNLRSLFNKILGGKEADLDRERQEYLLAVMKVDNCRTALQSLQNEKDILQNVLKGLQGVDLKLEVLLRQKDMRISQDNPEMGKQIMIIDQRILDHKGKIKELNEAVQAGKNARKTLKAIIDDLAKVISWSSLDYGGKGDYSTYKKKRFIDKASAEVMQVDALFMKFEEELHDVSVHYSLDYERDIDYYQDFLDTFLHNLITDYVVRKRIKNSLSGVEATMDRLDMTLLTLKKDIENTKIAEQEDRTLKRSLLLGSLDI